MKLTLVLVFACIMQISANTYAQSTKIDLSVSEMKVKDVLKVIESKTNFRFFYNDDLTELDRTLTLTANSESIHEILGEMFAHSSVSYKILENNVVIIAPSVSLQQQQISGTVTDANTNEALVGVTVVIEGTTRGTTTDANGKFTMDVPNGAVLIFSYIGYVSEKIACAGQSVINISLVPDITKLDEVVVIGYGTVKKRDLTGSVSSVKSEEIIKAPTSNALEAIQGKVTGVDIIRNSGKAGSGVTIRVRGNRSLGDPSSSNRDEIFENLNKPLFIIDGIQGASYSDLNPNDIESIEILKDASTTAIYGWQGANGVIIITTKKAKAGKPKISYNGYYGINGLTDYPKGRTGDDYIKLRREAWRTDGSWKSEADDRTTAFQNNDEWDAIQNGNWIDWTDLLLKNQTMQSHQLSVSNGNEKSNTYFSIGYYDEKSPVNDNYKKYNARFTTETSIYKWIKTGLQAQYTYIDNDSKVDALSKANSLSPLGKAYLDNGDINLYPVAGDNAHTYISPLTDLRENAAVNNTINSKIFASGFIELIPIKGLSIKSVLGVNLNFNRKGVFNDSLSMSQYSSNLSKTSLNAANSRNLNWDNIITYTKEISDHSVTLTGITSYTEGVSDYVYAEGYRQLLTSYLFYNLNATQTTSRITQSGYVGTKTMSYAGRLNYSFKGKYLVTLTERLDGNSRLSPGHKWSWFPSGAIAWRIGDETFIKNLNVVDNLKLRFSYGEAGNASIEPYGTVSGLVPNLKPQSFGEKVYPTYFFKKNKANENLEWERSATYNYGLDLSVLKDRINITTDIYKTTTTGLLISRPLPLSLGADLENQFTIWQNVGTSENKGFELAINTVNINNKRLRWSTTFTFSKNNEKIVDLIDGRDILGTNPEDYSLLIGRPIGSYYNYQKLGIWQIADSTQMRALKTPVKAGDIKLADLNNDSIIDLTHDRSYIGSKSPKWVLGFQNTVTFKGFDLSIYIFARWGQMIKNDLLARYNPDGQGNGPAYLNYWTPENPTNDFPRPSRNRLIDYTGYMTLPYVDGSFVKLKNITIGYTLPKRITQKFFVDNFRVYITASNLLTIANSHLVKYYDPENNGSETFPMSKQIIFGANIDL